MISKELIEVRDAQLQYNPTRLEKLISIPIYNQYRIFQTRSHLQ